MGHSEGCPSSRPYALNTSKALQHSAGVERDEMSCALQSRAPGSIAGYMPAIPRTSSAASKTRCGATLLPLLPGTPVERAGVHHQVIISHHNCPLALPELGPGGVLRQLPHQLPLGARGVDHRSAVRAAQLAGIAVMQQHQIKGCRVRVVHPPARGSSKGSGAAHVETFCLLSAFRGTTAS